MLTAIGLSQFLREQINGLDTILYPEGKQMSYTISKKIILARTIIKQPKVLILEDPLDQFNADESAKIIEYLTHKDRPWALVVVSNKKSWITKCSQIIILEQGEIKYIN